MGNPPWLPYYIGLVVNIRAGTGGKKGPRREKRLNLVIDN